jgi:hypothetical protein
MTQNSPVARDLYRYNLTGTLQISEPFAQAQTNRCPKHPEVGLLPLDPKQSY